jgi:phosphate transporter
VKDFEEYELVDYAGIALQNDRATWNLRTQAKRAEKVLKLDEADNMKFSHSIQFNAVPDWSGHYIAYSNLKKLYAIQVPECLRIAR